ncbi:MAG: peptidase [Marinilabiliales bacterium]|nr:MAG: peptidase [Marinilabiliales bacterium]
MDVLPLIIFLSIVLIFLLWKVYIHLKTTPKGDMEEEHKKFLREHVSFYNALNNHKKKEFEFRVRQFILAYEFVGNETEVEVQDQLLIAASAIIPIFSFKDWKYNSLKEIHVFPDNFNRSFHINQEDSNIRGLIGYGYLQGKLLISRTALYQGFEKHDDKRNTCLHEFIHLIDMEDGKVDGIPERLLAHKYAIPWMYIMKKEVVRIHNNYSDIHPYATTNAAEFLAVVSEYFFERPKDFKREHPRLFNVLNEIFKPDAAVYNQKGIEKENP